MKVGENMSVKLVDINGILLTEGGNAENIVILEPYKEEPYWMIKYFDKNDRKIKVIHATGNVSYCMEEEENK